MPTSVVRDVAQASQVQKAMSVLSPPNTFGVLRTLDRNGGQLPSSAFADAMPWMGAKLSPRLGAMETAGLLSRSRFGKESIVAMTEAGRDALRLQLPITRWASAHQSAPETGTGLGAYTEQALASLNLTHTVATLWALAGEGESVYPSEIQDLVLPEGVHPSALYRRLAQMESAGLVEREGEFRNYMYGLTQSGRDLMEPVEALARWAERHVPAAGADREVPTVPRVQAPVARPVAPSPVSAPAAAQPSPAAAAAARAQAATVRSTTTVLSFSHQAPPQAAPLVTASAPARHR
ncbi:winged helix-turn-helix transcriptional regulator [Kitasatospora sp. NPDC057965]|uniref:winged helix-turn-helix transcriptional regulator n=1 Tax=Kitasatospora sp. NPDC057965 TaxID=3346291 RepID=UPI0036DCAD53